MRDTPPIEVRPFIAGDIDGALSLWSGVEGLAIGESDTRGGIESFLERNPGFSAIAITASGTVVGAVLCGHNGRAGFLYHLAVAHTHRRHGIGTRLIEFCLARLAEAGIGRCNIFVYTDNDAGNSFWLQNGWKDPVTWKVLQRPVEA
jgi:putative acetyltransferase